MSKNCERYKQKGGFQCLYAPIKPIGRFIEKMKTIILKCF